MELVWTIPCQFHSIDEATRGLSLTNIVERLHFTTDIAEGHPEEVALAIPLRGSACGSAPPQTLGKQGMLV
jgi:hypothetical protein